MDIYVCVRVRLRVCVYMCVCIHKSFIGNCKPAYHHVMITTEKDT